MLITKLEKDHYQEVLNLFKDNPRYCIIYFCLKSDLLSWSPTTDVYCWKIYDDTCSCYAVLNILQSGQPYFHIQSDSLPDKKYKEISKIIFNEIYPLLKDKEDELFLTKTPFTNIPLNDGGILYYIKDEDYLKHIWPTVILKKDFAAHQLSPKDAKMMEEVYLFKAKGDINRIKNRINEFPSIGITDKRTNKIVSFMHHNGHGFLSHQYTFPEYRNQGLGTLCEKLLAKMTRETLDVFPVKGVSINRKYVQEYTQKQGYWTRISNKPMTEPDIYWTVFSKKKRNEIITIDI